MLALHENLQAYLETVYASYARDIRQSRLAGKSETYGEIYYYSALKLLNFLKIKKEDHFLDIGSGLGKLGLQVFLLKQARVTGIEINALRHHIASQITARLAADFQELPITERIDLIHGDFLKQDFCASINIAYLCSTVFSFDLLEAVGKKLNTMPGLQKIVSFRKLPFLDNFRCQNRLFLHCSWDRVPCYIYERMLDKAAIEKDRDLPYLGPQAAGSQTL